jgi:hypothetical protein
MPAYERRRLMSEFGNRMPNYITPFPSSAVGGAGCDRHGRLTERFLRCATPARHAAEEREPPRKVAIRDSEAAARPQ